MSVKKQKKITKKMVHEEFGPDDEMYEVAKRIFAKEDYVSSGSLQSKLHIPYFRARYIVDRMIKEGFCEEQIGARPCKIIKIPKAN